MRVLKLTLQYDGTEYAGWQRQQSGLSIQGLVEQAIEPIEGHPVTVVGAGRTDAGVHALAQVASMSLGSPIAPEDLRRALNARLPADVRVLDVVEAPAGFHARYAAQSKTYCYYIRNAPLVSPFERRYVWHIASPLEVDLMAEAARRFEGQHDFAAFQASGSEARSTVRTLRHVTCERVVEAEVGAGGVAGPRAVGPGPGDPEGTLLVVEVDGEGFLRHMVRSMVGTLVEIGMGRRSVGDVTTLLDRPERQKVGPTAPPRGLFLVRVAYGGASLYNAK